MRPACNYSNPNQIIESDLIVVDKNNDPLLAECSQLFSKSVTIWPTSIWKKINLNFSALAINESPRPTLDSLISDG